MAFSLTEQKELCIAHICNTRHHNNSNVVPYHTNSRISQSAATVSCVGQIDKRSITVVCHGSNTMYDRFDLVVTDKEADRSMKMSHFPLVNMFD